MTVWTKTSGPATTWDDEPASDPATVWTDKPDGGNPVTETDWHPVRESADRLDRDWETQRLVWRKTEEWTDYTTDQMKPGGVPGAPQTFPDTATTSVSFDGVNEEMKDLGPVGEPALGGAFTWSLWFNQTQNLSGTRVIAAYRYSSTIGTNVHGITYFAWRNTLGLIIQLSAGSGSQKKNYQWLGVIPSDGSAWTHVTAVFDPTLKSLYNPAIDGRLSTYINGVLTAPTTVAADQSFVPTGWSPLLYPLMGGYNGASFNTCDIYSWGVWDEALPPAEAAGLYNGGVPLDYTVDSPGAGYISSANLVHLWRPGANSMNMGVDYGLDPLARNWDLMDNATNIDASDIIPDWPGA